MLSDYKNILWDFDGVIIDSMKIRDHGFRTIFKNFPKESVEKLIEYHRKNGGLSRFHKIEYFFNEILKREIKKSIISNYADEFSLIMKKKLSDKKILISDTVGYISKNFSNKNFHIVSGSEHNELNFLCDKLGIKKYFISIHGSPILKTELVKNVIKNYSKSETCLIGDSINDFHASEFNGITFFNYNNKEIKSIGLNIPSFKKI